MTIVTDDDIDMMKRYKWDPYGYTRCIYPWGEGQLKAFKGPRKWQIDVLKTIGDKLNAQRKSIKKKIIRIARASGHGIGKSALISMICQWGLSTQENTRIVIAANTGNQVMTKTWPEICKWFRLSYNADWFDITATRICSKDPNSAINWRADIATWSKDNTEAFAGLHNLGSRIIVILDEASGIHDKVWEVLLGLGTDSNTEIILIAFGNPTRNTGGFRECFRPKPNGIVWDTAQIDSRDVEGTDKEYLDEIVNTYGENSDIVKVRVRGMFPSSSPKQFISTEDADAAFGKFLREDQFSFAPKIISCDPAWEGDDELVFGMRQGLKYQKLGVMAKNDNDIQVANILARYEDEHRADAVFVDAGYGTGIVSAGRTMGRSWQLVWFGGASNKPGIKNKRTEMWVDLREWLKSGGSIEPDHQLYDELIGPELLPTLDGVMALEPKKMMKSRGLRSPGRADALALTFAFSVSPKWQHKEIHNPKRGSYNPYNSLK